MSNTLERAIEIGKELTKWKVSPYKCLYHNPNKYTLVAFARWTQKYQNYKIYQTILKAADITGYEPVPAELLNRNFDGYSGRRIKAGKLSFYLIKPEEMTKRLLSKYTLFKAEITS